MSKNILEKLGEGMRKRFEAGADFDHPPVQTEEEKKRAADLMIAKKGVIDRAREYSKTPPAERENKKYLLAEIQEIVDLINDPFVLVIDQADGAPYSITFNPKSHKAIRNFKKPRPIGKKKEIES
ncbi:MAG TPA: hypothetical protein PKG74_01895 [Candidatus Colwellbacteria bacterium]|nr:hypothetical protein [Candidatus Colwellbacteria bacterium]